MSATLIKQRAKGQITLPAKIRKQLNITDETLFSITLKDGTIILRPVALDWMANYVRNYSKSELSKFIDSDKLDAKTKNALSKYLS